MRYALDVTERERGRQRALSPESRERRRETWARYRSEEKEAVRVLRSEYGLVPLAIADKLEMPGSTVARHLRELEREGLIDPLPAWLSLGCTNRGSRHGR